MLAPQLRRVALAAAAGLFMAACTGPAVVLPPTGTVLGPPTSAPSHTPAPATATIAAPAGTPSAALTPTPTETAAPPTATLPPATATPMTYVVVAGDAFIAIAERFALTAEQLLDANPGIDPNLIYPGQVLIIPDAALALAADARVKLLGNGLRLRPWPDLGAAASATLPGLTRLDLLGRSADNDWAQVQTPTGASGWVPVLWLDLAVPLEELPVVAPADAPPTATPLPGGDYVANVTLRLLGIYQRGLLLGNRPNVFSKVGDSITVNTGFLAPVGQGRYDLGPYTQFQPMIDYFSFADARDGQNAFANPSLAAKVGWRARGALSGNGDPQPGCAVGEAPLACEYRVVRPAVAIIMFGTNDVPFTSDFEYDRDLRAVLDLTIEAGVVPILSTIPPFTRGDHPGREQELNTIIRNLAYEYAVPLVDYYAAMAPLPRLGMGPDGLHPNTAPDTRNADFTGDHLQYGMVVRNLTALYALYEVWDKVLMP